MFTVILADKALIAHIQKYFLFLQPFFDKGDFDICEWNPQGETIPEVLPDLYDIVGKRTEWRAIVVTPFENEVFDFKKKNPFDVTSFIDIPVNGTVLFGTDKKIPVPDFASRTELRRIAYGKASALPLTRLGLYLSLRECVDFLSSYEQEKIRIEKAINNIFEFSESVSEDSTEAIVNEHFNDDVNREKEIINIIESIEYLEYLNETKIQQELISKFYDDNIPEKHLLLPAPTELYFISPRQFENANYDIALSAIMTEDGEYSRFAQFNMYPASARFIVYDMHENEHSQYEYDFVCFLEFLFTFATNEMPQSKMRPERLYRAVCDNNFNLLIELLSRYEKKLSLTETILRRQYDELIEDSKEVLSDETVNSRYCSHIIVNTAAVNPQNINGNLKSTSFGLFGDQVADIALLLKHDEEIKMKLKEVCKKNSRAILTQCEQTRNRLDEYGETTDKLTSLQEKDIIDFALESENIITSMPQIETFDTGHTTDQIKKAEVEKVLEQRVSFKKFIFVLIYTAIAFLFGYVTFLNNWSPEKTYSYLPIVMLMVSFGLVVVASIAVLFILKRYKLGKALHHYHYTITQYVNRAKSIVDTYSMLLAHICEVFRSYVVVAFAKSGRNQRSVKAHIIQKHILDIRAARAAADDIFGKFELQNIEPSSYNMIEPYEHDFSILKTYKYELPFAESDIRKIKFMGSEFAGEIPIGFISEIDVIREEIL